MTADRLMKIFIHEDNKTEGMLLRLCISAIPGVSVENFPDGHTLLSRVDEEPKVLITGLNDERGIDLIQTVRSITPATEIIVLSAQQDIDLIARAQDLGIYNYVVKSEGCIEYVKVILEKLFGRR